MVVEMEKVAHDGDTKHGVTGLFVDSRITNYSKSMDLQNSNCSPAAFKNGFLIFNVIVQF